jgi:hypothetical protein
MAGRPIDKQQSAVKLPHPKLRASTEVARGGVLSPFDEKAGLLVPATRIGAAFHHRTDLSRVRLSDLCFACMSVEIIAHLIQDF